MRFSSLGFRGKNRWLAVAAFSAVFVAGCSEDPGLQERLNRLQAEMQEKDRQLQDAQSTLEKTKSELKSARASTASKPVAVETPASTPQSLSREQVEESYATASKAMQKRLASELRSYTVENCTQFPVVMPSDEFPYHSKVALSFRSDGGRAYRLEFPVSADAGGKWTFPDAANITSALADSRQQDQTAATTASNPTPAPAGTPKVAQNNSTPATTGRTPTTSKPELVPGQAATETRVVDWGGGRSTGNNNRPSQSPATTSNVPAVQTSTPASEAAQPTPQQNKAPAQTMPSDRDVKIHW